MCKTICMNRKEEFSGWQALERIPENCGCGGRATVCRGSTNPPYFWVECEDCHVSTMAAMKLTEAEAIAVWNKAMGERKSMVWKPAKNRPAYEKGVCSCGYVFSVLQNDFVYCPSCGARLEWI